METPRESAHPVTSTVPTAMRQNALQSGGTLSTPTRMETRLPPQRMDTKTASRNVRSPIGSLTGADPVFSRNPSFYLSATVSSRTSAVNRLFADQKYTVPPEASRMAKSNNCPLRNRSWSGPRVQFSSAMRRLITARVRKLVTRGHQSRRHRRNSSRYN